MARGEHHRHDRAGRVVRRTRHRRSSPGRARWSRRSRSSPRRARCATPARRRFAAARSSRAARRIRSRDSGKRGLELLALARRETGLPIVTEALDEEGAHLVAEVADCIQIGARNMQNYSLLRAVGKINKPVLLKRGMAATITDLLMSAEYILAEGNGQVILCERGIRSFDTTTRNLFDLTAIPIVQRLSHLPMIADPSHGTGLRDKVIPMARAAVAAGADGILVEVHPTPDRALSDGGQSLYPDQFARLVTELRAISSAIGRAAGPAARPRCASRGQERSAPQPGKNHHATHDRFSRPRPLPPRRSTALGAQATDPIDRAVAAWAKVKTVKGTFEQTVTNSITGTSATSRGEYVQERPNRLAIRFTQPDGGAIVADGKVLWVYLPSSSPGQVVKRPATDRRAVPIDSRASSSTRRARSTTSRRPARRRSTATRRTGFMLDAQGGHVAPFTEGHRLGRR